jgi:hypothetical protein
MGLVVENSLSKTLDNANDVLFLGRKTTKREAENVSEYISSRFGLPGGYRGLFAPSTEDTPGNVHFFTGEPIKSRTSIAHILSEESIRILKLLDAKKAISQNTLRESTSLLAAILRESEDAGHDPGVFCCGNCTSAYWRNLLAVRFPDTERRISLGLKTLKECRTGNGRWRNFPFYYTSLVLTEMESAAAKVELQYVAPVFERAMKRKQNVEEKFQARRSALAQRVLELV